MAKLPLKDIQGIIIRGYGYMPAACFVLLRIKESKSARTWLYQNVDQITDGENKPIKSCMNLAFTYSGLKTLGLDEKALEGFSRQFQEGMTTEHRQRILGDYGESAPENWSWGGPKTDDIHLLLMLYAPSENDLESIYSSYREDFGRNGLIELGKMKTILLKGRKEHFGFRDGIAQPLIIGLDKQGSKGNRVKAGEFLLGYQNEYDKFPFTPLVPSLYDPRGMLPPSQVASGAKDFGINGSYLVFRQLAQDVVGFWDFIETATRDKNGMSDSHARLKLASKMVGRWPSGAPLVKSPDQDNPGLQDDDRFGYHKSDPYGERCPIGSHIRRSNPRDSMEPGPNDSLVVANRHRIIRRGRDYGDPVAPSMEPQDILSAKQSEDKERGLHFICFNADIGRQFEFIQQTWVNNPKFEGLYDDADPIMGAHESGDYIANSFTVQSSPIRQRICNIQRFVHVRGGAYFFMPSIPAARYLASL